MFYISIPYIKDSFKNFVHRYFRVTKHENWTHGYGINYSVHYDEDRPNFLQNSIILMLGDSSIEMNFPAIIKPAVIDRPNRKTVTVPRSYGFKIQRMASTVDYGIINMYDYIGVKNKSKRFSFPWQECRSTSLCVLNPTDMSVMKEFIGSGMYYTDYELYKKELPKPTYEIVDYDGSKAIMTALIERHVIQRGSEGFEWLRRFRKPEVEITLKLTFDQYLGTQKHSWKGGSAGASVSLKEDETLQDGLNKFFKNPQEFNREFRAMKLVKGI
ncbi:hypothetical protein [Flavobacterium sp.]|jgi:hypothetical protein|uniref:hypothetical protein n=1 Tax=Flavobacterium sp. TaxID=239 RepID=UPI0037C18125